MEREEQTVSSKGEGKKCKWNCSTRWKEKRGGAVGKKEFKDKEDQGSRSEKRTRK